MDGVRNFIKLDWLAFKAHRKYLLLSFFPMVSLLINKSMAALIGASLALLLSFMIITHLFASEEKNGMARLYGSLPMNKKDVVIGRYFNCTIMGLGCILAGALPMGMCSVVIVEVKLNEVAFYYSLIAGIFFFCLAVQLPILLKRGYIKGQIPAMITSVVAMYVLLGTGRDLLRILIHFQTYLSIILAFVGLLCLIVSLKVSIIIYERKDA